MNILRNLAAIILVALVINGCDYVQPYTPKVVVVVDTTGVITSTITDSTTVRNVLIEDYSGHHCGNCPLGALELDTLINVYGQQVVPVNIQAGFFANYLASPYTTVFSTSVGNDWDNTFGISAIGNPAGMVDRHSGPPNGFWDTWGTWPDSCQIILPQPNAANIKITNVYRAAKRSLTTTVTSTFLLALPSSYKLSVVVTEDSIIDYQLNYHHTPEDEPNYVFNHMLKASFNGSWGDTLATAPTSNASYTKTYTLALGSSVNTSGTPNILVDKHCHVVAFIYDVANYNVVQAVEAWVTQ
jgi:hypothetical protein